METVASLLRMAVASPRKQYVDENNRTYDLAYVTSRMIVCSMPTTSNLRTWYRIPAEELRTLLEHKHKTHWKVWNFRAEGQNSYDAADFDYRVEWFPFPDHHPPPFRLIPEFIQSIDKFLSANDDNVAVLHCKAGQGRSGTMACAYLMASTGMSRREAIAIFTQKRMRSGFGDGVAILSQRRYLNYVDNWLEIGQLYHNAMLVEIEQVVLNGVQLTDLEIRCNTFNEYALKIVPRYVFKDSDVVPQDDASVLVLRPHGLKLYMGPDIQLSFVHMKNTIPIPNSTAYIWLNSFFETYVNKKSQFSAKWEELDGFIGTRKRGRKAFDSLEVTWKVISNPPFDMQT